MANRKRLLIEVAGAVLLLLLCLAFWSASQRSGERRLADAEAGHQDAFNQQRQEYEVRAERLAAGEAEAVFRAFAAGIQGSALAQQRGMLEVAKGSLLRLPHVAFVHILGPDGAILASSNGQYEVAGRADARADWALGVADLETRQGDLPGTIEVAAPFQGASGRAAVLWLGYKTQELLAAQDQPASPSPGG
jgi:hypothetical protein